MRPMIDSINVFWLDLDVPGDIVDELSTTLTPIERQRVARITSQRDRHRAAVSLAKRRAILADFCGESLEDIDVRTSSSGKPFVMTSTGTTIEVSSSQSGSFGLFAVSRHRSVGVDIESLSEIPESDGFASWVATANESEWINTLEASERTRACLRLWARKEACLKASGEGIGSGMNRINVPTGSAPSGQRFCPYVNGAQWLLFSIPCPQADLEAALVTPASVDSELEPKIFVSRC